MLLISYFQSPSNPNQIDVSDNYCIFIKKARIIRLVRLLAAISTLKNTTSPCLS